jgi:hypothetical protein
VDGRVEMGGRLACPEAARLALLHDDAMDVVEFPPPALPLVPRDASDDEGDLYRAAFHGVRARVVDLLGRADVALATRFALVADLAERLGPMFHRGGVAMDGAAAPAAVERLGRELSVEADAVAVASLEAEVRSLDVPLPPLVELVATLLWERRRAAPGDGFAELAGHVLEAFGGVDASTGALRDPARAAERWVERSRALEARHGAVFERFQRNAAVLWWMQEPYTTRATLHSHLCRGMVRLAMLRMLVLGHPATATLLERGEGGDAALGAVAVESAWRWSRAYEHRPAFLDALLDALEAGKPSTLGRAVCLARLFGG